MKDTERCAAAVAKELSVDSDKVLVMSTGVIGQRIRIENLLTHLPRLTTELASGLVVDNSFATAITTTGVQTTTHQTFDGLSDLVYKKAALEIEIDGKTITLGGACKGSGMINPNMATMLGLITCDAPVDAALWKQMLTRAMDVSFNRVDAFLLVSINGNCSNRLLWMVTRAQMIQCSLYQVEEWISQPFQTTQAKLERGCRLPSLPSLRWKLE